MVTRWQQDMVRVSEGRQDKGRESKARYTSLGLGNYSNPIEGRQDTAYPSYLTYPTSGSDGLGRRNILL